MIRAIDPITEVEAKGRNGYFKVARAVTFATEDGKYADICFYSRRQGDSAPLVIKGEPAALKALLGLLYNSIEGNHPSVRCGDIGFRTDRCFATRNASAGSARTGGPA